MENYVVAIATVVVGSGGILGNISQPRHSHRKKLVSKVD